MNREKLQAQLALEEGCPPTTYYDSKGILSGGVGHNLIDEPEPGYDRDKIPVPQEMIDKWFAKDIQDAIDDLDRHCPWWREMDDVRQNALLNLCFNMGWMQGGNPSTGLASFKNSREAMRVGDYARAANGFRNSDWARDVGPNRRERVCKMIETGQWQM